MQPLLHKTVVPPQYAVHCTVQYSADTVTLIPAALHLSAVRGASTDGAAQPPHSAPHTARGNAPSRTAQKRPQSPVSAADASQLRAQVYIEQRVYGGKWVGKLL